MASFLFLHSYFLCKHSKLEDHGTVDSSHKHPDIYRFIYERSRGSYFFRRKVPTNLLILSLYIAVFF